MATQLLLARHGETEWNRAQRFQGHTDIPLNRHGEAQAEQLAQRMSAYRLSAVYSSDLLRARATAAPSAKRFGLEVKLDLRLRERCFGIFEGHTYQDIEQLYPDQHRRWVARDPDFAAEGGESLRQVADRTAAALNEFTACHEGEAILLITHGGVLDLIYRRAQGLALDVPRAWATPNAAFNELHAIDGMLRVVCWADEHHLARPPAA